MNLAPRTSVLLMLAAAASAQSTYVVDAAMGAGAHFRDIPAAIQQATHGDRILIRSGVYSPFSVNKGVAIMGGPKVYVDAVTVSGVPAGRTVLIKDLTVVSNLRVTKTLGLVQLEHLTTLNQQGFSRLGIHLTDATMVRFSRCSAITFSATRSTASLFRCNIDARKMTVDAMYINSSIVMLSGCSVAAGSFYSVSKSAIYMSGNCSLVITDDGSSVIATNSSGSSTIPAVFSEARGTKIIAVDPRVVFRTNRNAPSISKGPNVHVFKYGIPFVEANGAPLGGTVKVELKAVPSDFFFLAVGAPSIPTVFPAHRGALWLDLGSAVLIQSGRLGASGKTSYSTSVPIDNALFGRTFVWQGLAGANATAMILSNPSSYTHGR